MQDRSKDAPNRFSELPLRYQLVYPRANGMLQACAISKNEFLAIYGEDAVKINKEHRKNSKGKISSKMDGPMEREIMFPPLLPSIQVLFFMQRNWKPC